MASWMNWREEGFQKLIAEEAGSLADTMYPASDFQFLTDEKLITRRGVAAETRTRVLGRLIDGGYLNPYYYFGAARAEQEGGE